MAGIIEKKLSFITIKASLTKTGDNYNHADKGGKNKFCGKAQSPQGIEACAGRSIFLSAIRSSADALIGMRRNILYLTIFFLCAIFPGKLILIE